MTSELSMDSSVGISPPQASCRTSWSRSSILTSKELEAEIYSCLPFSPRAPHPRRPGVTAGLEPSCPAGSAQRKKKVSAAADQLRPVYAYSCALVALVSTYPSPCKLIAKKDEGGGRIRGGGRENKLILGVCERPSVRCEMAVSILRCGMPAIEGS